MDRAEIQQLVDRHGTALVLYARQWCLNPDDAVQEAFCDLIANRNGRPNTPVAWLFKVTKRKAMNQARAEQRRKKHHEFAANASDSWFEPQPEARIVEAEVEFALKALGEMERQVVVARIWGELTFDQIAEVVSTSSSAAHRQYHQALKKMATRFSERTARKIAE